MKQAPARINRDNFSHRPILATKGVNHNASGSALIKMGRTEVLATVFVDDKPAPHMRGSREGWLTAEYAMLPHAGDTRHHRDRMLQNSRRHEIQRLIGRALRASLDLSFFRGKTIYVDCDVLVADGGTRVASILAASAAVHDLCNKLILKGAISEWPVKHKIGAVSVGLIANEIRVDLDFNEDQVAIADLNVVATGTGMIIEVQGGCERGPISFSDYQKLLECGMQAIPKIIQDIESQV